MHFSKYLLCLLLMTAFCHVAQAQTNKHTPSRNASDAKTIIGQLAGVYKNHNRCNGSYDHEDKYDCEDILELVPVSDSAVYVKVHLEGDYAGSCTTSGIAEYNKQGDLVLKNNDDKTCLLAIKRKYNALSLEDPSGEYCNTKYCGQHTQLEGTTFQLAKKRKIRYMAIILKSREYQAAIEEYKTLHPKEKIYIPS